MSEPSPPPSPLPPSPWVRTHGSERPPALRLSPLVWANRFIVVLLGAAVVLLLLSMAPALGRELGLTQTRTVSRGALPGTRSIGEPSLAEKLLAIEALEREGLSSRHPSLDVTPDAHAQPAESLRDLAVYAFPSNEAPPVGVIREGDAVQIARELGGWAMVQYRGPGGPEVGWVPRSALRVR